ncbi:hypothetical protein [Caenimonas aquaedulcis]|nr:hypothetical protein [Caenimonas aquaedulcis]
MESVTAAVLPEVTNASTEPAGFVSKVLLGMESCGYVPDKPEAL